MDDDVVIKCLSLSSNIAFVGRYRSSASNRNTIPCFFMQSAQRLSCTDVIDAMIVVQQYSRPGSDRSLCRAVILRAPQVQWRVDSPGPSGHRR